MNWPSHAHAQKRKVYPQNYFRWPLNIKPEIVANLGELRSNHWHMGLDMRTQQRQNLRVYAAAGGYISRIRVEKFGFGRSIVINHPNGLSTLYAHLNDFFPALEKLVEEEQYKQETWAIELTFPPEKFPVSKGQFIAYSGTTGGSQGPHVHFEIRSIETGECLNPLFFGLPLTDHVAPTISKLAMYDRGKSIYHQATQFFAVKKDATGYSLKDDETILTDLRKLSFGIQAFDRISGSNNQDGIYAARIYLDGELQTGFILDSISYTETGYMNAHIDYSYRFNGGPYIQHLSQLPGEYSGVYHNVNGNGIIHLNDTSRHEIRIEAEDTYGHKATLTFFIQHTGREPLQDEFPVSQLFLPNYVNLLEKDGFEIYLPEQAVYDTVRSFYLRSSSMPSNAVSAPHQVNNPSIPIHGQLKVRIRPDKPIADLWRDRIIIRRTHRSDETVRKAEWENGWLSANFGDFGTYQAFVDLDPPEINAPGKVLPGNVIDVSRLSSIRLRPTDNFDVIKSFRAELNGKWLRFANDKGRWHVYKFDKRLPYGTHTLTVTVEDLAGNKTTKTWTIKRNPRKK